MSNLVEGAARQKTPNEIALNILLASARLAKITVSHSQALMVQPNQSPGAVKEKTVVRTEPTTTTNITGGLTITRGSSLRNVVRGLRRL
ncbi:hypothetical protein [Streptomyces canus]|uniref:hypothetical protein n=1 Tax=Streptomyces canus TaxID=58343 RepID=UPI003CF583AA